MGLKDEDLNIDWSHVDMAALAKFQQRIKVILEKDPKAAKFLTLKPNQFKEALKHREELEGYFKAHKKELKEALEELRQATEDHQH